jgi:broad specificity phosphatase PhoE
MLAIMSMSIIYLARHGPSASAPRGWLSAAEFRHYLHGYDAAGLMEAARAPDRLIEAAARSDEVIHSPLLRAVQTVELIDAAGGSPRPHRTWAELVEAAQPAPDIRGLRLPLQGWDALTRILWLLGRSGNVEPRQGAITRARTVAERLTALSTSGERGERTMLVVGHGFQNILIAGELRRPSDNRSRQRQTERDVLRHRYPKCRPSHRSRADSERAAPGQARRACAASPLGVIIM